MDTSQQKNAATKGKDFFLDTTGACFLCLKDPSTASTISGCNVNGGTNVSLRELCRYLEISELEGFLSNGEDEEGDPTLREQYGFAVALCETCVIRVKHLVELIHQMEEIQKRMTRQLQEFQGILEDSLEMDQSKQQWEKILKKNRITAGIVGCLREEVGRKCREKIKNPSVKSTRDVPVPLQTTSTTIPEKASINSNQAEHRKSSSSLSTRVISIAPTSSELAVYDTTNKEPSTDNLPELESSRDTVMEIFGSNYRVSGHGLSSRFECRHCEFVVTTDARKIRMHLLADHPEALFAASKPPHLSEKVFRDCTRELLRRETEIGIAEAKQRNIPRNRHNKSSPLYCVPCERTYAKGTDYRYNLFVEHYFTLRRKLVSLQEDVSKGKDRINREPPTYKCDVSRGGCGRTFASSAGLERHKRESCPSSEPHVTWQCKTVDGGCGKIFARNATLVYHQSNSCPKLKRKRVPHEKKKKSRKMAANSSIVGEEDGDHQNLPTILHVRSESESLRRSQESSVVYEEMEAMDEDSEAFPCESGVKTGSGMEEEEAKTAGRDATCTSAEGSVKKEIEDVDNRLIADSTTTDDNMFECEVFPVKSEL